ncbi:MAG: hypothetical protein QM501_15550 [Gimesia sp.]
MTEKKQNPFIHITSSPFTVLPGEAEELVNDGIYGKALAQYFQSKLIERGYSVPFICCEDWGWWVEIQGQPFTLGICVYGIADENGTLELCLTLSTEPGRRWSWSRFKLMNTAPRIEQLLNDVKEILLADDRIVFNYSEHYPL